MFPKVYVRWFDVPAYINDAEQMRKIFVLLAVIALASPALAEAPLGRKPGYTARLISDFPNAAAATRKIWVPELDEGFVPQGVTFQNGALFISSYRSTDPKQDRGPCRVYALDPDTGRVLSKLDLPLQCGHAGGLARAPSGNVIVADTRHIFEIEVRGNELVKITQSVPLSGKLKGSFAASTSDGLWLGAYERSGEPKLFRIPWKALGQARLSESDAVEEIPLPLLAQGAAFNSENKLWVSRSGSKFGELVLVARDGSVLQRHGMPIGLEDLSFAPDGSLWTLSEAGSQRWNSWQHFYPVIIRFDMHLLK